MVWKLGVLLLSLFASSLLRTSSSKLISSVISDRLMSFSRNTTIPKKFKWSGELRTNIEGDHKERLCNATLSDASDGSPTRLRFSICFNASVSFLLLEKLFCMAELQSLRPALLPVAEIAKIGPETQADEKPFSKLFFYMSSLKLACPPTPLTRMNRSTDAQSRCRVPGYI